MCSGPIEFFDVLSPQYVTRCELPLGESVAINGAGEELGFSVTAFPVPGKIALWLEDKNAPNFGTASGDTLGLEVTETRTGKSFFYVPGCAELEPPLAARLKGAALVFFDGTLWRENEMIDQGLLGKTGSRMGHMNMSGADGTIAAFQDLAVARKIFVHINNSNPVLDSASRERVQAMAAGWEIGFDGMEVTL